MTPAIIFTTTPYNHSLQLVLATSPINQFLQLAEQKR